MLMLSSEVGGFLEAEGSLGSHWFLRPGGHYPPPMVPLPLFGLPWAKVTWDVENSGICVSSQRSHFPLHREVVSVTWKC